MPEKPNEVFEVNAGELWFEFTRGGDGFATLTFGTRGGLSATIRFDYPEQVALLGAWLIRVGGQE